VTTRRRHGGFAACATRGLASATCRLSPIASSRFRTRSGIANPAAYRSAVTAWHEKRAALYAHAIREELSEDECRRVSRMGRPVSLRQHAADHRSGRCAANSGFEWEIIPGITSIQALAARHRISLNEIGEPVHITTGRRLDRRAARRRPPACSYCSTASAHSRRWLVTTSTFIGRLSGHAG